MQTYEYTVVPAASRGEKAKGLKTPADRFAHAMSLQINAMAAQGWEYVRAEVLPSEERSGLTGRTAVYHNLLVFRRPLPALAAAPAPGPAALAAQATPAAGASTAADASPARATPAAADPAAMPEYPASSQKVRDPEPIPDLPPAAAPLPAEQPPASLAEAPPPRQLPGD